ncbi:MAG: hypothetical protein PHU01_15580, partial [Desulfuromonadaceae bacterium]|nr:hypothetical protein [Desulfuromonadaceae bacterium]
MNSTISNLLKKSMIAGNCSLTRWISVMLLVLFMSVGTGGLRSAEAATQEQIDTAITNGIAYLLSQQSVDGYFTGDFSPATTGFSLTA